MQYCISAFVWKTAIKNSKNEWHIVPLKWITILYYIVAISYVHNERLAFCVLTTAELD